MAWWAVDVTPSVGSGSGAALAAWLVTRTGQAVEEQGDGTLVTFAEDETTADTLIAALAESPDPSATARRRTLEAVDWTTRWRDGIEARRFGRLVVAPSWVDPRATEGEVVVVVDPEMAFGTGEHGSTRAALSLLARQLRPGDTVLDLGSGSGILSIAAVKLGATRGIGIEIDGDAIVVAERNAAQNGVSARCTFLEGDAADLAPLLGPVDLVLSNILRTVNLTLLPVIGSVLRPGGLAIFSGMEESEAPLFLPELSSAGFEPISELRDAGWWAVAARRRA
jgi:ribosomal protein L11 methyltransferase